jgi:lipopolysaccharide transport system ATP-binding protein
VGTGMHPELTGLENIYLNGAILGMTKKEIRSKVDEIVAFAGMAKYINTPFKRYSSGMRVRLGFAVAAFLEPEILIVDEVLAVGDAEFQKKAIGKMKDVSQGQGRTVLFVSHNMASIKALCNRAIVLENGKNVFSGSTEAAVDYYINKNIINKMNHLILNENSEKSLINLLEIKIEPNVGTTINVESGINMELKFLNKKINSTLTSSIIIVTEDEIRLFEAPCFFAIDQDSKEGIYYQKCIIPPYLLNAGTYVVNFVVGEAQKYVIYKKECVISFDVEDTSFNKGTNLNKPTGILRPNIKWEVNFEE